MHEKAIVDLLGKIKDQRKLKRIYKLVAYLYSTE